MFSVRLIGVSADGDQGVERIPRSFASVQAAMDYAEDLMENHTFPWGQATSFVVTDASGDVVVRGAIHFDRN